MVTSDFRPEVEIWPFRACAMHLAISIGTVRSLWTKLWGIYDVSQNSFLSLQCDQPRKKCPVIDPATAAVPKH